MFSEDGTNILESSVKFCVKEISPIFNLLSFDPLIEFPKCEKDHVRDKARFPAFPILGQMLTPNFLKSESHHNNLKFLRLCKLVGRDFSDNAAAVRRRLTARRLHQEVRQRGTEKVKLCLRAAQRKVAGLVAGRTRELRKLETVR